MEAIELNLLVVLTRYEYVMTSRGRWASCRGVLTKFP